MSANARSHIREKFWEHFLLEELNHSEWEALCDGCGTCCLVKFQDEDEDEEYPYTERVYYTNVACQLLDCSSGHCSNYPARKNYVPECIQLTYDMLKDINWLPKSCAYRTLYEKRPLPKWHPLITGDPKSVIQAGVSVANRCVSEKQVHEEDMEDHLVRWVHV